MFDHTTNPLGNQADEIADRALKLVETGPYPDRVYFCVQNRQSILAWNHPDGPGQSLLLFTTPHQAMDYAEATQTEADLGALPLQALPRQLAGWKAAGVKSFVLNRCPRCAIGVSHDLDRLGNKDDFLKVWAVNWASRAHKGEELALAALELFDEGKQRESLSTLLEIRDHVECSMPQLHVLIGYVAKQLGDDRELDVSLDRLAYFPSYEVPEQLPDDAAILFADVILAFRDIGT